MGRTINEKNIENGKKDLLQQIELQENNREKE